MKISIILPCYNEEDNIKRFYDELIIPLQKFKYDLELVLVDDGSSDNTLKEARNLQKKYEFVKIIQHPRNLGLGSAIRTGINNVTHPITITLDSDLTFNPQQIPDLVKRFNQQDVDVVIGSPFLGDTEDVIWYRMILSKLVNILYNILLLRKITSVSPIFRLYRTDIIKNLQLTCTGFDINAEILFKSIINGARIAEIPAKLETRKYGISKLNNLKEIKNHVKLLSKMLWWRIQQIIK